MTSILDACAMLAYLTGEPGGNVVDGLLRDKRFACHAHSINLCEVYYLLLRGTNASTARAGIQDLFAVGVIERSDMTLSFWESVGNLKAKGKIALPDCFCLTLAQELSGQVVTSDTWRVRPSGFPGDLPHSLHPLTEDGG